MDAQRSSAAPVVIDLGGTPRTLQRLSQRMVRSIIAQMPAGSEVERRWYTVFDLQRWACTPEGSLAVLAAASGRPVDEVAAWGSEVSRATAASTIVAESVLTGEEPEPQGPAAGKGDKASDRGPDFPGTSSRKPALSRTTRRGWAILGRLRRRSGTPR